MNETRNNTIYISRNLYWMLQRLVKRSNKQLHPMDDHNTSVDQAASNILAEWFAKNEPVLCVYWDTRQELDRRAEEILNDKRDTTKA